MTDTREMPPIACSLGGGNFKRRAAWIASLNARVLLDSRREGDRLELDYDPSALADVRQMVALEQQCCAFLTFEIVERPAAVTLSITAPEGASEAAGTVFALFEEGGPRTRL